MTSTFVIDRDCGPKYEFDGELIASASSLNDSGSVGRWVELRLYKTVGGKYICERCAFTCWENELDSREAEVALSPQAVVAFFGYTVLSKKLYNQLSELRDQVEREVGTIKVG